MKLAGKTLCCLLGGLSLCATPRLALAVSDSNPYQPVVERNAFGIHPPPPPPAVAEPPKPPSNITLTGITTIFGNKRALLKVNQPAQRGGGEAKDLSLMLSEGQCDSDVEVIQIDEKAGAVTIKNGGTVSTLTFEKNGNKDKPGAGGPVGPGGNPSPAIANRPASPPAPGLRTIPTRTLRLPGAMPPRPAGVSGSGSTPTATSGIVLSGDPSSSQNSKPAVSLEEQMLTIEAQRQQFKDQGSPLANLLPPTALGAAMSEEENQQTSESTPTTSSPPPTLPHIPGQPLMPQ